MKPKIHIFWAQGWENAPPLAIANVEAWGHVGRVELWDDARARQEFPFYAEHGERMSSHAMRADVVLMHALYQMGGFAVGADMRPLDIPALREQFKDPYSWLTHDESHDYIYNGAAHFSAGHHPFLAEALQLLALRTERFGEHDAAAVTGPLLYQTTWDAVPAIFRPARISSRTVFLFDWWDRNSQRPCAWIDPGFAASWDGGPPEFWQGS